jgi:hypothetical protein
MERLGGTAEIQMFSDREKTAKLVQFHRVFLSCCERYRGDRFAGGNISLLPMSWTLRAMSINSRQAGSTLFLWNPMAMSAGGSQDVCRTTTPGRL